MTHLLVTNDFPPKVGGIQTYLWELWRRFPPGECEVLTTSRPGSAGFDRDAPMPVHRVPGPVLLPRRALARQIVGLAADARAKLVVLDPVLPLGLVGPRLGLPYAVVLHGAEVTVPGRLPGSRQLVASVIRGARGVIAAGGYPAAQAASAIGGRGALPELIEVPPGVDTERFRPLSDEERGAVRRRLGLGERGPLVVSASRLVPRKGMDVLIEAATRLVPHRPALSIAIAGGGRDAGRLRTVAGRYGVKVVFLGRVADADLADLYASADVFAMVCRNRWRGLEQEGFGIVFLEAAACGVAQVAGDSGGAAEAVIDGVTGLVVTDPSDPDAVARALARVLDAPELRARMGAAGRRRAEEHFRWDDLSERLLGTLRRWTP